MNILVLGGTRFFGIHMVNELLAQGHDVTIATRGKVSDEYGDRVKRVIVERTNGESMKNALSGTHYDVVIDKIAYCSNDIKYVMETVDHDRYIHMSSTSVYDPIHRNTVESDFNGDAGELVWCDRKAFPYEEIKRQAEYALWQEYSHRNWVAVRYPFVLGKDDYTKRLLYYVEHTMRSIPMSIDNLDARMGFIHSVEAGKFMAFLVDRDIRGAVNGSSEGTISIREIIEYVEKKTGTNAAIDRTGETAPYNGAPEYSINTEKANALGFRFSILHDWIYELLDYYIDKISNRV
ncbi:MAG: NAD-dependent epimerase/dehydratase family protein [Acetatifactor sp.]|nr:NAD-dependent epimerase/dehydratase family protein [Acetatifactor sp.]MDE7045602.1 NAD-dependent epimerase/dehydratase family protein [Acetatifactor sp.]